MTDPVQVTGPRGRYPHPVYGLSFKKIGYLVLVICACFFLKLLASINRKIYNFSLHYKCFKSEAVYWYKMPLVTKSLKLVEEVSDLRY